MAKLKLTSGRVPAATKLPTPSVGLNKSLGGGLLGGRIHILWGPKASGKTTMAFFMMAEAQKQGKICMFLDSEKTYDESYGLRCGVDVDSLLYGRTNSVQDSLETIMPLIKDGKLDVLVVDSLSSLALDAFIDKEDSTQMGIDARSGNVFIHKLLSVLGYDTNIILIAHGSMVSAGHMGFRYAAKLSKRQEHWASTIIKLTAGTKKEDIREDGAKRIYWSVEKSKQSRYPDDGEYWFNVCGDFVEFDNIGEVARLAIANGLIEKKGAWFNYGEEKFHGEANFADYLRNNPDVMEKMKAQL